MKAEAPTPLATLKAQSGLSNKAWDKAIKGLTKLGLASVAREGEILMCYLKDS